MPGLWASMTENDYALHTYNFDSPAHDGSSQRYVYSGGVGCTPHSWNRVLHRARSDHGKQHLRVTAEHVILSYSADEADPDDPDAGMMVSDDAEAFAERVFDGHASVFSVQKDGRSGLWHAHLEIANVSHGPTRLHDGTVRPAGYALHESQRGVQALRKAFDKFLLEHRGFDNVAHMEAHRGSDRTRPSDQLKRDAGRYVWVDDLKQRINEHMAAASDFEDFKLRMGADNVTVYERGQQGNLSYAFLDQDGKSRLARAGGRQGLGTAYGREEIVARLGQPVATVEQPPAQEAAPEPVVEQEAVPAPAPRPPSERGNPVLDAFMRMMESTPAPAPRAPAPAPEPEPVVEGPVAAPVPDFVAEELARRRREAVEHQRKRRRREEVERERERRRREAVEHQRKLREGEEQLDAEFERIATQDGRKLRLEKYRRQRYRLELLRLFLRETLGPAAANVALPWPAEPSQGQKERADDLAEQFVEEWVKQGQLIGESSVKRPAVGREGPQGPGRW